MPWILRQIKDGLETYNFRHLTISVEAIEAETVELIEEAGRATIPLDKMSASLEKRLIAASRFGQMRAPSVAVPAVVANVNQACCEDHVRPAEGNGKLQRSASVLARRELGRYFRWKSGSGGIVSRRTVYDFNHMTNYPDDPRWHGKLAVICIDGKGFTKLRSELCTTAADLKQFSDELNARLNQFHIALMEKWAQNEGDSRYFYDFTPKDNAEARKRPAGKLMRFQRLVTAGDDAKYLMPAWLAWEFLKDFFEQDWRWDWPVDGEMNAVKKTAIDGLKTTGLTFRAGVVICHAKAPIHSVRDLAEALESEVADKDGEQLKHPIAYEILKSYDFIGPAVEEYRKKKRAGLEPHEALLDGGTMGQLERRLKQLKGDASSGEIKSPLRWADTLTRLKKAAELPEGCGEYQLSDFFHMSQWRDFIF
jgi:hypothetical protein